MSFSKDRIWRELWRKWLTIGVIGGLILAGSGAYDYFKYAFWSQADAVVDKIQPTCSYHRSKWFSRNGDWERIDCEAKVEATKLIAEGYVFTGRGQRVVVSYEAEPGRKTYARLSSWPSEIGPPLLGGTIRIRYSPNTPSLAEPATDPNNHPLVIAGLVIVLAISFYVILTSKRPKEQAR